MQRIVFNFLLAMEAVNANTMRSFLTALGIVFGVGAVIAMLAIGSGAKKSILDQMKLIGTNNIVINAKIPSSSDQEGSNAASGDAGDNGSTGNQDKRPFSPGLTLNDLDAITATLPSIEQISPEVVLPTTVIGGGRQIKARCVGVTNAYFELNKLPLGQGHFFHPMHVEGGRPVCVIGKNIQTKFFSQQDPIGQRIKCGATWLTIIGVLERRSATRESLQRLGIRDYNDDIYIPVTTALIRFKNRAAVAKADLLQGQWDDREVDQNYHQLDRVVVRVNESHYLQASANVLARLLKRRHLDQVDFEIEVPELLLEQEQKTQDTFNMVLAAIAGISLLVGGIGIMNIMLASVMERIKEIGVRRSLGATQIDIIQQFLFEAITISLLGGVIGIILGVSAAKIISSSSGIPTIVSGWSILLSFGVAAIVGLAFGIFPARKAAMQDPIKALRTE